MIALILYYNWIELVMNQSQLKEILKKKDSSKMDSFIMKNARKKQQESDLMNLMQSWVHCLLYYKNIYPQQVFVQRRIFGISVFAASAPVLKKYLNDFFVKIKPQISHINNLKVLIYSSKCQLIEVNTLHIEDFEVKRRVEEELEELKPVNSLQQQIEMKQFLSNLKQKMISGFVKQKQEGVSFRFRIGYRLEQANKKNDNFMLENWLKRQNNIGQGKIVLSLKSQSLNLIYQVCS